MSSRHTVKGQQTRAAILETAVNIASIEGLEALTIGRLATELGMSKSGLFGHFGAKEELQRATVETARQIFIDEVVLPARQAERGLARLWLLCDAWLSYMEREVFPGGCFFTSASAEFDNRPGPIRDQIAAQMQEWLDYLMRNVEHAQSSGQLASSPEPAQLAFELHALALGADWAMQLYKDHQAPNRARRAILTRLQTLTTPESPPLPSVADFLKSREP